MLDIANFLRRDHRLASVPALGVAVLHLALIPGLFLAIEIGRPRFFAFAWYVILAVGIFDVLIYFRYAGDAVSRMDHWDRFAVLRDWRVLASAVFVTVATLATLGRGLILYTALAGLFLLVLFRAVTGNESPYRFQTTVGFLVSVAALSIVSRVFTVAYLAETSDTIVHTAIVSSIVEAGSISQFVGTRYWGYLVFHVFSAIGVEITRLPARELIAIVTAIAFLVALVALVLAIRYWADSYRLALVAGVLVGCSGPFLNWATQAHYQSLSFVFFALLLFAFTKQVYSLRVAVCTLVVSIAWVGTHHVSLLIALVLTVVPLAVLYAVWLLRDDRNPLSLRHVRNYNYVHVHYLVFVALTLVHWTLVTDMAASVRGWIFERSTAASTGLPTTRFFIQTTDSISELAWMAVPYFIRYSNLSVWAAFGAFGALLLVRSSMVKRARWIAILAGFFAGAVFLFPNPLWFPMRGAIEITRWWPMTIPVLVVIPAFGIRRIFVDSDSSAMSGAIAVFLVFSLLFLTIGSVMSAPSLVNLAGYSHTPQDHVSQEDLSALSYIRSHSTASQEVYGTSLTHLLAFPPAWKNGEEIQSPGIENARRIRVSDPSGHIVFESGLSIVQVRSFTENAIRTRTVVDSGFYRDEVTITTVVTDEEVSLNEDAANLVYSNGETIVVHRPSNA